MSSRPLVIAHRGASGYLPEHTREAKVMAHALGADYLEQDLVLTRDAVPVVLHDIQIDTISDVATRFPGRKRADGHYYALDFVLAELKQLRVFERFNPTTGKPVYPGRFPKGKSRFEISTLEEELELIQGLNQSTGRTAGIYPELKSPAWHREQGHDISKIVLPILARYGYATKSDLCFVQCFEREEVLRLRRELGWKGNLVWLLTGAEPAAQTSAAGLKELARVADGIGPALSGIVTGTSPASRTLTSLTRDAHAAGLVVHPYTLRTDALPRFARSAADLLDVLFKEAGIDGLFTDFTDVVVTWLTNNHLRGRIS